jgi:SOS-response transcriptional repressor LexA
MTILKKIEGVTYFDIMNRGQAGAGRLITFPQLNTHETTPLPMPDRNFETWTVVGDSLNTLDPNTTICDGDKVATRTNCKPAEAIGRLCVLLLYNSEYAIKRVFRENETLLRLESNNSSDKAMYVENDDVEVLGVIEFFIRKAQ